MTRETVEGYLSQGYSCFHPKYTGKVFRASNGNIYCTNSKTPITKTFFRQTAYRRGWTLGPRFTHLDKDEKVEPIAYP